MKEGGGKVRVRLESVKTKAEVGVMYLLTLEMEGGGGSRHWAASRTGRK